MRGKPPGGRYATRKTVAVDVDGTLVRGGVADGELVEWLRARKAEGYELYLWSAGGAAHARAAVERCGLEGLFDAVIGKPGYLVDDQGWGWIKWVRWVRRGDYAGGSQI